MAVDPIEKVALELDGTSPMVLAEILQDKKVSQVRRMAALNVLLRSPDTGEILRSQVLSGALMDADVVINRYAMSFASSFQDDVRVLDALYELIKSSSAENRGYALRALAQAGVDGLESHCFEALETSKGDTRRLVIDAMGYMGTDNCVQKLRELIATTSDKRTRVCISIALIRSGDVTDRAELDESLESEDLFERILAAVWLAKAGNATAANLLQSLLQTVGGEQEEFARQVLGDSSVIAPEDSDRKVSAVRWLDQPENRN